MEGRRPRGQDGGQKTKRSRWRTEDQEVKMEGRRPRRQGGEQRTSTGLGLGLSVATTSRSGQQVRAQLSRVYETSQSANGVAFDF